MLEEFLKVGLEAVKRAEEVTMKYFGQLDASMIHEKKADASSKHFKNPATIADEEAEHVIKEYIKKHFPDHGFVGEEEWVEESSSEYTWIIDPIDGTKAYSRGMDDWAILLALQKSDEIVVGVSCMPVVWESLWAVKGQWCFLNGEKCQVSDRALWEAFISHERFKYFKQNWLVDQLESLRERVAYYIGAKTPRGFHYLVQWKMDAIVGVEMQLYDVAPYVLMVQEARGRATTLTWEDITIEETTYVMSNGVVHEELLGCFK